MARTEEGSGTLLFVTVLFVLGGLFNVVHGIVALAKPDQLINQVVFSNLTFWGTLAIIVGALQLVAAGAIVARTSFGRTLGVILASASLVFQFLLMGTRPWWGITVIILDLIVIYALTIYKHDFA